MIGARKPHPLDHQGDRGSQKIESTVDATATSILYSNASIKSLRWAMSVNERNVKPFGGNTRYGVVETDATSTIRIGNVIKA